MHSALQSRWRIHQRVQRREQSTRFMFVCTRTTWAVLITKRRVFNHPMHRASVPDGVFPSVWWHITCRKSIRIMLFYLLIVSFLHKEILLWSHNLQWLLVFAERWKFRSIHYPLLFIQAWGCKIYTCKVHKQWVSEMKSDCANIVWRNKFSIFARRVENAEWLKTAFIAFWPNESFQQTVRIWANIRNENFH